MKKDELEPSKLTGAQKTAIFLLAMGEDYTTQFFKQMDDDEIRKIASEMSEIDHITPQIMTAVMEDFISRFEDETSLVVGGESFLKSVIGRTMDRDRAANIFSEIEDRRREVPFIWSRNVNPSVLAAYLEQEHPQTIAMVLTHFPYDLASDILMAMPDERKGDIALRIANLGQVPEEVVREVDQALKSELAALGGKSGSKSGGLQVLVDIINGVDKATEDLIMESIEEQNADMANNIREMMFVFEDLARVDDRGMREILKKVESQTLVLAMKTASEEMKQKILSNLSARAAEMLAEDLEVMGPVRLAEVEEAQQVIARAAKELEAEGTIVLGGKGKEDVLV